ncbi:glycosyltransferase [Sediminibacterium sp. KACHI17]|uniref:Glycosyltransferase n=1 Tax=Sediminibacterium sp. KACHI17 TaxID=1751071 RepID=A0AAT9GKF8_9BACT
MIRALNRAGYRVYIASHGPQQTLLQKEFPENTFLSLPGYQVRYSRSKGWLPFKIMQQLPAILRIVQWEHRWLDKAIEQYGIDLVISDNRYGLWTKKCPTVFITHQLQIKAPFAWLERLIQKIHYRFIERFSACWVPDQESGDGLAGTLSHPIKKPAIPVTYIGLLSRFQKGNHSNEKQITVLLSGPEPQRTILEEQIIAQISSVQQSVLLVRGLPAATNSIKVPSTIKAVNHLTAEDMQTVLQNSALVIARSGYSSLMDFSRLHCTTILIPTPGQTEQVYLAKRCAEKGYAVYADQSDLDLINAITKTVDQNIVFPSFHFFEEADLQRLIAALPIKASS